MVAEHAAEAGNMGQQVGQMILHHIVNGPEMELPWVTDLTHTVHLPHIPAFEVLGIVIDMSITRHVVMMLLAAFLLILMALFVRRKIALVPRGFTSMVESFVLFIRDDVAKATMGAEAARRYTPYLCTTFFFILTCNLLGLIPYGATATSNVSVTAALALMSFFMIQGAGMRKMGVFGYFGHLIPPGVPFWLAPVMFVVELMGVFAKPFALCIRLFANMVAGHVVILSLIGLVFVMNIWVFPVAVGFGVFMYLLELFVALLQAYIFTMLTSLFIGLLVVGEH
jgi:F-type H+-transporting ATPase subunit a